jgi:hypothetical protein
MYPDLILCGAEKSSGLSELRYLKRFVKLLGFFPNILTDVSLKIEDPDPST